MRTAPSTVRILAALAALGFLIVPLSASAGPGDPRTLQGTLVWSPGGGGGPFVVLRTDDSQYYIADLSAARSRGAINVGDRISVVGVEGIRPFEIATGIIGPGDSALSASAPAAVIPPPGAAAAPSASPPTMTAPGPIPAPSAARTWRRLDGTVQSISNSELTLRDATGASVSVDVSGLRGDMSNVVQRGDEVTVFATAAEGDDRLVAVGFVHSEPATGSALPRGR
jgi:hypothetical protein